MPDWYVSSAAWTAITQFAASGVYTVGQIVRPLTAPAFNAQYAFRCTTAGTASTEPAWPAANNGTVTTGGATFTNVAGQGAYGWSAAAGNLYSMCAAGAGGVSRSSAVGDRIFLSSDHSESNATINAQYVVCGAAGYGSTEVISVNRAGSVPPVAGDALAGATILCNAGSGSPTLDAYSNVYWQGVTINMGGAITNLFFNNSGYKGHYFKNCAFVFSTSVTNAYTASNNPGKVILDNTTVQFNNANQKLTGNAVYLFELIWINTPSAVLGTVPSVLFSNASLSGPVFLTCRGVDLSAVNTTLVSVGSIFQKVLFDSCRIASGVIRLASASYGSTSDVTDEIELINCFDGTNILSERHTPAGDITTNRTTTLVGGAQDDIGLFSHQLMSSTRADPWVMTLDSFWMDVENTYTGAPRTATVELVSNVSLNNNDITLLLEYQGTSGSSLATLANSLPSPLTATAALPTSTATWTSAPGVTFNPTDAANASFSNGNLTITSTSGINNGGSRGTTSVSAGKFYFEAAFNVAAIASDQIGVALSTTVFTGAENSADGRAIMDKSGQVWVNGVSGPALGTVAIGAAVGIAFDATARLIWWRASPAGNWNASGTANPATGVGGVSISFSGALFPYGAVNTTSDQLTANFGATAFAGTVPSGFTSGIPAAVAQHIQVPFTPQQAGRVRGLVRLGKASTTVYVNPQIIVT